MQARCVQQNEDKTLFRLGLGRSEYLLSLQKYSSCRARRKSSFLKVTGAFDKTGKRNNQISQSEIFELGNLNLMTGSFRVSRHQISV
jgi:hypothetical protein